MSFLTFEGTRPWAKAIKAAVITRKMPPWFADPRWGHFANERSLTEAEIKTWAAWVDARAPEGNPKDKPAPVEFPDGWQIKPDVVISMPHALPIPAAGRVEYQNIVLPTGFTKDTWASMVEVRPRNRAVVQHAAVFIRPPGSPWLKDAQYDEPYIQKPGIKRDENGFEIHQVILATPKPQARALPDDNDPSQRTGQNSEWLAAYIPGMQPWDFLSGQAGKLIPARADIVINLHFTPNGTAMNDGVDVGMVLAKEAPQRRYLPVEAAASHSMVIPAGDPNYEVHSSLTFDRDVQLVWFQPHMHVHGKT